MPEADVVEVVEEETELAPTHTGLVVHELPHSRQSAEEMLWLAENIESLVTAKKKIMVAMLKMAVPGDWVSFSSDKDPDGGTASLGYDGAMRIAEPAGISFVDRKVKKIIGRDKEGEWYRYECEVTCIRGTRQARTWGRAGTRDVFFGKADDKWKDLSEVNEGNVKMAAIHGAMKEGVKVLLGIPNFPVKDLINLNVNVDFTRGHKFKSKSDDGKPAASAEDEALVRTKLRAMLMEIHGDDQKKAADALEALSSFQGSDGPVKGKRLVDYLKGGWLMSTYSKVKVSYKEKFGKEYVPQAELPGVPSHAQA